jgi:hypothetical protein
MTPRDASALIVDKYLASYTAADGVTCSACDLSKANGLAEAVAGLAAALRAGLSDRATLQSILTSRTRVQSYEVRDNIDLADFCDLLGKSGASSAITTACQNVIQTVRSGYVEKQGYKGGRIKNSNGVAIYFPTQAVSPLYGGLDFSNKTGWDGFLKAYLTAVRSR